MAKSLFAALLLAVLGYVVAECPNACSSHGKCGAFDTCQCYRNWMASDCSERVCPFGLSHVDSPKGDLDASGGALTSPDVEVIYNSDVYGPQGTTEQFPATQDSNGNTLINTAHGYTECSNKGLCDRASGTCNCFTGYGGHACQRAECPTTSAGECSGHGVCETIRRIAELDYNNVYRLWDQDSTMGCVCDAGYSGADCSQRQCKWGVDPLYVDAANNARVANFTYQIYTVPSATNCIVNTYTSATVHTSVGGCQTTDQVVSSKPVLQVTGNYSIVFFDAHGEDWHTIPIDVNADCPTITSALYQLPNDVIPFGSVRCNVHSFDTAANQAQSTVNTAPITYPVGSKRHGVKFPTDSTNSATKGHAVDGYYPIYDNSLLVQARVTLAFTGNPGLLQQIRINKFLDGTRPSMFTNEVVSTLGVHVFANGFTGENTDFVPDLCQGVSVTLIPYAGITKQLNGPDASTTNYRLQLSDSTDTITNTAQTKLLKACLGDSDGNINDNVDVYNWDYGSFTNPHLIKLVDQTGTPGTFGSSSIINGQAYVDPATLQLPITPLCASVGSTLQEGWSGTNTFNPYTNGPFVNINPTTGVVTPAFNNPGSSIQFPDWCYNFNSPGFYAVLIYDAFAANAADKAFKIFTRAGQDYSTTTTFSVFTTTGTLQMVSRGSDVFTQTYAESNIDVIQANLEHSNTVYFSNVTTWGNLTSYGSVDCETQGNNPFSPDCLNKDDFIMLLNIGSATGAANPKLFGNGGAGYPGDPENPAFLTQTTQYTGYYGHGIFSDLGTTDFYSNPIYPNIYQVKKISREDKSQVCIAGTALCESSELYRHQMVLNYGLNAQYTLDVNNHGTVNTLASVFKFYPPNKPIGSSAVNATGASYSDYAGECSFRGLCDHATGLCNCFAGYTSDNCGVQNALAK